jgi:hypothetical protein
MKVVFFLPAKFMSISQIFIRMCTQNKTSWICYGIHSDSRWMEGWGWGGIDKIIVTNSISISKHHMSRTTIQWHLSAQWQRDAVTLLASCCGCGWRRGRVFSHPICGLWVAELVKAFVGSPTSLGFSSQLINIFHSSTKCRATFGSLSEPFDTMW